MTGTKAQSSLFKSFLAEEDGAVTADWVVLAAAVCLLSVPLLALISSSTETATIGIAEQVVVATE